MPRGRQQAIKFHGRRIVLYISFNIGPRFIWSCSIISQDRSRLLPQNVDATCFDDGHFGLLLEFGRWRWTTCDRDEK